MVGVVEAIMVKKSEMKYPPLEEGLLKSMQALDNQIARAVARTPAEREVHGVQKWEPIGERVERVSAFILDRLGEQACGVDSVIVLSQAFAKALVLLSEDLGVDGLGQLRTQYILRAGEILGRDAERLKVACDGGSNISLC